jgi:hypothetical protein
MAFQPNASEIGAVAQLIARPPRDPRFGIEWKTGSTLRIVVDARDLSGYLNDQPLALELASNPATPIPQTGPGRYELDLPAPRSTTIASILIGKRVVDRCALAGRYAKEFDAIGNDLDAFRALANRSGGAAIEPTQHTPIDFRDTHQPRSLAALFAILGSLFIAAALMWWRVGR